VAKPRGRPATITRDDVVNAALRLARQVGLDRFTIQQLADELGVAPMTLYHYVSSRSELVQLVVEELLSRVEIPGPETGAWDVRLKTLQASARRELGGIPGIQTAVSPHASEAAGRLVDAVLAMLADAGFDEETALLAFGALFAYMIGQLDLDVAADRGSGTSEGLAFVELMDSTAGSGRPTPDEIFDFGFSLLLAGLHAALRDAD
jgi:TetR/AcrR family transcriptional regulator, tetracycline repressor protein